MTQEMTQETWNVKSRQPSDTDSGPILAPLESVLLLVRHELRRSRIPDAFDRLLRDATSPTLYRERRKGLPRAGLFSFLSPASS